MKIFSFYSNSARETIDFAKRLSKFLKKGDVLGLFGNLGSGKTTFIKGLAKGLGFSKKINSPSFVILKIYNFMSKQPYNKTIQLFHFDLYRLKHLRELEDIGYDDFISGPGICVIEWADKAKKVLPANFLKIKFQIIKDDIRKIKITSYGKKYDNIISKIKTKGER